MLGLTFNITGTSINVGMACSARFLRQRVPGADRAGFWLKKTVGGLFVGLGARLAFKTWCRMIRSVVLYR